MPCFLLMTYYLIFSLCLFETIEVILDKFEWIFIWVRKGHKAAETTDNVNVFGPGPANKRTVELWFKKFCRGDKSLDDKEHGGWPWEVDNDQLRGLSKLILLQSHKKLSKNSVSTILQSFSIWSKLGRWKSLISGCLMSWLKIE